jgi:hypothetical protein
VTADRPHAMLLHMRKIAKASLVTTITASALLTAATGFAAAAPTGPSSVDRTVSALKADGYAVILNRIGGAPLSACSISAIRPGQEVTRTDSGNPGDVRATTVVSKTVYVDVAC